MDSLTFNAATRHAVESPESLARTFQDIVLQAHTGEDKGFQKDFPNGGSALAAQDFLDASKTGSSPNDFPFLEVYFPVVGVLLYLVGIPILNAIFRALKLDGSSSLFKLITQLHNLLLIIYSGWAAYQTLPVVFAAHSEYGFWPVYCASEKDMAIVGSSMVAHIYLNYVSKFWEFFDTVILLVRNKRVSNLQSYHHAGIVTVMWMISVGRNQHGIYMVCFNAFVHTIMYTYFLATSIGLGKYLFAVRPFITSIQLMQFFIGIYMGAIGIMGEMNYWPSMFDTPIAYRDCQNSAQSASTLFTFAYLCPLIVLFANFFLKQYVFKTSGAKAKTE